MAMKLSAQEKKDLDKFTKFLVLKSAQVIVDSRLGHKTSTQCKSSGDWFNVAVPDLPDVLREAKRALNEDVVLSRLPLCVEISLRTVEGDQMVLESWCLGILPEQYEYSGQFTQTVYSRMGVLLKSLVSVTRVTPAYKLSRRQGPDTYIILYRIYMGEPMLHTLGDGYKVVRVGQLCMPIGTMHLTVSYRTKMTISPTTTGRDNSIMLKSDHFNTNLSPRHIRYKQKSHLGSHSLYELREKSRILSKTTRGLEATNARLFATVGRLEETTRRLKLGLDDVEKRKSRNEEQNDWFVVERNANVRTLHLIPWRSEEKNSSTNDGIKVGAFAARRKREFKPELIIPDVPFSKLLPREKEEKEEKIEDNNDESISSKTVVSEEDRNGNSPTESQTSDLTMVSTNDDFIMVDLKTPFASKNANSELGMFYREWQTAPPLQTFTHVPTLAEQVQDLTKQLESFESDMNKYDDMLLSLCQSPNNN